MDFSSQLDGLQHQVADAKLGVQIAAGESRDQLRRRIAEADQNRVAKDPQRLAEAPAGSRWKQMKSDAAAKMDEVKARMDKRAREMDAGMAATDADLAEADASAAIEYASYMIDNARLAALDAIDARAYANMVTRTAS
jgi:hypothetical protein